MTFSDTSTKLGLIQDCEMNVFSNYGDISSNTNRLYDFTARINRAYDKLATKIMSADGRWQFDDTNYTDLPIGSTDIVSGQAQYSMDVEFLDVEKVVSTDSAGNKSILIPRDINDPIIESYLQDVTATGGIPRYYDKKGNAITLYPTPNYSRSSALVVHYRRKPSYFAHTDTTKPVGVPFVFHRYLSLEASLDYMISKQHKGKNDLATKVAEMEATIEEFYSKRSRDEQKHIIGVRRISR